MDIAQILTSEYAGSQWTLKGESYNGLTWLSDTPKPTLEELQGHWAQVQFDTEYEAVEKARQAEYQKTTDPLFFSYQRGDNTEQEWLDAVQAVKDANLYPQRVFFDANTGVGSMDAQLGTGDTALTVNSFTLDGHTFDAWNTAADGSGTVYADEAVYDFSAELTLFAQWTAEEE